MMETTQSDFVEAIEDRLRQGSSICEGVLQGVGILLEDITENGLSLAPAGIGSEHVAMSLAVDVLGIRGPIGVEIVSLADPLARCPRFVSARTTAEALKTAVRDDLSPTFLEALAAADKRPSKDALTAASELWWLVDDCGFRRAMAGITGCVGIDAAGILEALALDLVAHGIDANLPMVRAISGGIQTAVRYLPLGQAKTVLDGPPLWVFLSA